MLFRKEKPAVEFSPEMLARKRRWRRIAWAIRLMVLAFMVGYPVIWGLDGCFYFPDSKTYYTPQQLNLRFEDVHFRTSDGLTLHGWWLPTDLKPARGTIVHFHGNAANVSGHLPLVSELPLRGYNVLMFDYRGYGQSEGRVTRAGTIRDGHAAIDYALSRPGIDRSRLFIYGQSLGGAIATVVAAERPEVRALVVEASFSRYRSIAALHAQRLLLIPAAANFVANMTISGGYEPIDFIGRVSPRPVLVVVGEIDQICFPELGRELFDAASEPKRFWTAPRAEHLQIVEHSSSELFALMDQTFEDGGGE